MNAQVHPEQGAFFDLSARTKLRVTGADRLRYLNGQICNDLRKASDIKAIYACVLSAKGKINADVFIHAEGASFLLDADPQASEQLIARLERYVVADDVVVEDVTDQFALFHLLGTEGAELGRRVEADRYGQSGVDFWISRTDRDTIRQQLTSVTAICDAGCEETFRIERGIPRWGRELTEEIIPTEANLEGRAIDYAKGCYIGQEVISRIKMSGQTNKRLVGLVTASAVPLQNAMRLWTTETESKDIGWISSATTSARVGSQIALGFVKHGYQEIGTQLVARATDSPETIPVQIAALPFI